MNPSPPTICALGLALVALAVDSLRAAEPTSPAVAAASRDYVVFFGLEVFVNDRGKLRPVIGGSERGVLVRDAQGDTTVPLLDVRLMTEVEPRLGRLGVTIEALDGHPVHSPAVNPTADAQSQLIAMQNIDADRQEATESAMRQAENAAMAAGVQAGSVPNDSPDKGAAEAMARDARAQASLAAGAMTSVLANPKFDDFLPGSTSAGGGFDGFEVSFRVSASEPCSDAYGVLRLFVLLPGLPQAPAKQALKVFHLRTLDARPRKVIVRKFGLPVGATVESYDVHLYAGGRELATNLSANRVEVTEVEAHQFLVLRHVHRNGGATLPAQVAKELRPDWPRAGIAADWEHVTVTLRISEEGAVDEVSTGAAIGRPLTEELEKTLRQVRFLPALVSGRSAASTGTFALGELFRTPESP